MILNNRPHQWERRMRLAWKLGEDIMHREGRNLSRDMATAKSIGWENPARSYQSGNYTLRVADIRAGRGCYPVMDHGQPFVPLPERLEAQSSQLFRNQVCVAWRGAQVVTKPTRGRLRIQELPTNGSGITANTTTPRTLLVELPLTYARLYPRIAALPTTTRHVVVSQELMVEYEDRCVYEVHYIDTLEKAPPGTYLPERVLYIAATRNGRYHGLGSTIAAAQRRLSNAVVNAVDDVIKPHDGPKAFVNYLRALYL